MPRTVAGRPARRTLTQLLTTRLLAVSLAFAASVAAYEATSFAVHSGLLPSPSASRAIDGGAGQVPGGRAAERTPAERHRVEQVARAQELVVRYRCSYRGLGPGVVPAHAVVLDGRGDARVTSFDRGWAMFTRQEPGTLVAVCRL